MKIIDYRDNVDHYMNHWTKYHYIDELTFHGCQYDVFDRLQYSSPEEADEGLIKKLKDEHYDFFFTAFSDEQINPDIIKRINKIGIPTVSLCPDNLVTAYRYKNNSRLYTLVWLMTHGNEYLFEKWGANYIYQPSAANPNFIKYRPPQGDEVEAIGFIGNPHGSRIVTLNKLIGHGVPVIVHCKKQGDGGVHRKVVAVNPLKYMETIRDWIRYPIGRTLLAGSLKSKLTGENYVLDNRVRIENFVPNGELDVYMAKYALSLSYSDAYSTGVLKKPLSLLNLRFFELPMSGGVQFIRYSDEGAAFYEDGKEIVFYHNDKDMIEKAKFYLSPTNEGVRNKIRKAARLRSEKENTWWNRFCRIFDELGLKYDK